ncbi:MAG: DUF29 domain-containing protein [Acetobacteraceae bacterium]
MSDLYDRDILEWSERQAALLRRVAEGERLHQRGSNEIDWLHIAEEIEDVGNEQRNTVESLLVNIMRHRLQIMAWPEASAVPHWQHEIDIWQVQVRRRLRRSPKLAAEMRDGLGELYPDALASMYREIDGVPRPPVPPLCPWTLDDLLSELP